MPHHKDEITAIQNLNSSCKALTWFHRAPSELLGSADAQYCDLAAIVGSRPVLGSSEEVFKLGASQSHDLHTLPHHRQTLLFKTLQLLLGHCL